MMKKLPSPTASSTMRTWLPGRLSCSTAWRSGKPLGARQRHRPRESAASPPRAARSGGAGKPDGDDQSRPARARLPDREADQPRHDQQRDARPGSTSGRRLRGSSRSSSDGLTCRTSSSGTSENSSDTSRPMPSPCATAGAVSAYVDVHARRRRRPARTGWRASRAARGRRRAGSRPGRARPPAPCRSASSCDDRAPTHFSTAMLLSSAARTRA